MILKDEPLQLMRSEPATQLNRRLTNTKPQNVEVNPVPSWLSLPFLHDSDLIIRRVLRPRSGKSAVRTGFGSSTTCVFVGVVGP
jgi:hypothetical protein